MVTGRLAVPKKSQLSPSRSPPPFGRLKLIFDGSSMPTEMNSGFGLGGRSEMTLRMLFCLMLGYCLTVTPMKQRLSQYGGGLRS